MEAQERFFKVTRTEKWKEHDQGYYTGKNHEDIAAKLELENQRIYNERYRIIEQDGSYYMITEQCKAGKTFIYEIIG